MSNNKFYTPDGFTDQLPEVCAFKREAENKLRNVFIGNGYREIETPGVEYCDIYTSTDLVNAESLYKFCDQKGRLLCARYDGTVPAVRFATNLLKDEPLPLRLFYVENMYRFNQTGGGKQNGFTQGGVEFMGAAGSEADGEVISIAIESALAIGIKDLQISDRDMTKYILGTIADLDAPLTPSAKGARSRDAYLCNDSLELIQKERDEIIGCTCANINALCKYVEKISENECICVLGGEEEIEKEKDLFDETENLFRQ